MNQYGYVPSENAHLLQQEYTIATPATWQFEKGGFHYGGVEEIQFTEAQKAELLTLGGNWFESAQAFQESFNQES